MTPYERILAAVALNPDRPRVTLRRADARSLIADNQRLAAEVERLKTGVAAAESMMAEMSAKIQAQVGELDYLRGLVEQLASERDLANCKLAEKRAEFDDVCRDSQIRADQAAAASDALKSAPSWLAMWLSWIMYAPAIGAGWLLHWHG